MKFSDLQAMVAELVALGVPGSTLIQFQCSVANPAGAVCGINPTGFVLQGMDATYALSGNPPAWAAVNVSQQPSVILGQQ
jgi:hypothetical protein